MQHRNLFLIVALATSAVQGAGFASECSGISMITNWLVASCPSSSGSSVTSSVVLPDWVNNHGGTLQWGVGGGFEESCSDCSLTTGGSTLQCTCKAVNGQGKVSTLNLETSISNVDGHLMVSMSGSPNSADPPSDSSVPVPSNFEVQVNLIPDDGVFGTAGSELTWSWLYPASCWYLDLAGPTIPVQSVQNVVNPGYEIAVFSTQDCSGTPLATISPDDTSAHTFSPAAMGLSLTPLWNYD